MVNMRFDHIEFGLYNYSCLTILRDPYRYHVPRSFLADTENRLVLFEEFGGNPSSVTFQTVAVMSICANAREGYTLELSCQGQGAISDIKFASFGDSQGNCEYPFETGTPFFVKGTCESADALPNIQKVMNSRFFDFSYIKRSTH